MFEESPGPIEKHEHPSLLDSKPELEDAKNTAEIAVMPSEPAELEETIFSLETLSDFERIPYFQWS